MYHIGDTYFLDSAYGESKKKKKKIQVNLFTKQKQTQTKLGKGKGGGEGHIGSLGLRYTHYHIYYL